MAEDNSIKTLILPVLLAGGIGAGGTGIVTKFTDEETVINAATIESCAEFVHHGKTHQRHDDSIAMLKKELEILTIKLECNK